MSTGQLAFLGLVLFAFATFMVVVGFVSIWSRTPRQTAASAGADAPARQQQGSFKTTRESVDPSSSAATRPARAA